MNISSDGNLEGDAVLEATRRAGVGRSAWLAAAAADRLRSEALAEFLDSWESTHAPLTPDELAQAERELGLSPSTCPSRPVGP